MNKNSKHDIDKAYVSPYDHFLAAFEKKHPLTASQIKEREKAQRIARLRDHVQTDNKEEAIWEDF